MVKLNHFSQINWVRLLEEIEIVFGSASRYIFFYDCLGCAFGVDLAILTRQREVVVVAGSHNAEYLR